MPPPKILPCSAYQKYYIKSKTKQTGKEIPKQVQNILVKIEGPKDNKMGINNFTPTAKTFVEYQTFPVKNNKKTFRPQHPPSKKKPKMRNPDHNF